MSVCLSLIFLIHPRAIHVDEKANSSVTNVTIDSALMTNFGKASRLFLVILFPSFFISFLITYHFHSSRKLVQPRLLILKFTSSVRILS
jgi:hypothetical protein